jgi:CRP-like cAMP-binding protein
MRADLPTRLKGLRLFARLEPDELEAVAACFREEVHPAGTLLGQQGHPGRSAYFVEQGSLRLLHMDAQGREAVVGTLGPGAFFGETSLLLGEPHDVTIEVTADATLLALSKDDLDRLLKERPLLAKALQIRPDLARRRRPQRFKWLDPDEQIVVSLRKHNAHLANNLALPVFVLAVVCASVVYFHSRTRLVLLLAVPLALIAVLAILYLTIDHFNDRYIVTNKRVVHDERHLLLRDLRTEAPLRAIQNIEQVREGLLARTYNLGDLIIETAGERGHVVFRHIPDPRGTQELIFQQIARVRAVARAEERAAIRAALKERLAGEAGAAKAAAEAQPAPPARKRAPSARGWLRALRQLVRFFLPPLRTVEGETITWRKHWIALIRPLALPSLLIVASSAAAVGLLFSAPGQRWWQLILIVYGLLLVFALPWWLWRFEDWKNDLYQVTATRIIDIERLPFDLRETRREASLGMVQNVNLEIPGPLGKLLHYGSVTIETAGAGAFTFDLVKDPRGVQAEIFRRMEAFQERQQREAALRRREELVEWFAAYDQMRSAQTPDLQPPS